MLIRWAVLYETRDKADRNIVCAVDIKDVILNANNNAFSSDSLPHTILEDRLLLDLEATSVVPILKKIIECGNCDGAIGVLAKKFLFLDENNVGLYRSYCQHSQKGDIRESRP